MGDSLLLASKECEAFGLEGEEEEDLDAFNDETFGGEVAEWEESAHEELAQLTEAERKALQNSNDFFEFGSEDGECLEPEPKANGKREHIETSLSSLSLQPAQPQHQQQRHHQQPQQQHHPQQPPPLPLAAMHPLQHAQYAAYPVQPQVLLAPSHFQQPTELMQDPAIMSFSKVPPQSITVFHSLPTQMGQPGSGYPPPQLMQPLPPHINTFPAPPSAYPLPPMAGFHSPGDSSCFPRQMPPPPPAQLGFPPAPPPYTTTTLPVMKTIQDVEKELLYGSVPPPPHIQTMNLNQRNLNYPGMRDRQQFQSVHNNTNAQQHQQAQKARHPPDNYHHQRQQTEIRSNYDALHGALNRPRYSEQSEPRNYQDQNSRQQLRNQIPGAAKPHHNDSWDGEDRRQQQQHRHSDRWDEEDGGSWRWKEQGHHRSNNQDSATRRDLMPGHVHVLGILRHSRSRRQEGDRHHDPDDDCLGSDAPLLNPTGDPLLDARLEREQAELASRCRYFDETEDEYAGLMSQRDKQFIINIQLSQLKCDNPFIDDYYYTMFTAKKEASDTSNDPHFLLNESGDNEVEYVPTQFHNSLGRLQVVTVKAPRQIIDLGVMRCPDTPPSPASPTAEGSVAPGATVVKTQAKRADLKQMLLQIERLYSVLLEVEALKLKLSAIPTGAPLREQVTLELTTQIQLLVTSLSRPGLITQMLQVRKGRGLLSRCLSHLPGAAMSRICQEMTGQLGALCRETCWADRIWPHLARYIAQASLSNLEGAVSMLARPIQKGAAASALTTLLTSPLGLNAILALLQRAATAAKRGQDKISVGVWRDVITKLLAAVSETSVATPLVAPPQLDIGFLLTLSQQQMAAWDAFLATVEKNYLAAVNS